MNLENILSLVDLLDPLEIIDICPQDEYKDFAKDILELLKQENYKAIEEYIKAQYVNPKKMSNRKIEEFMNILRRLK